MKLLFKNKVFLEWNNNLKFEKREMEQKSIFVIFIKENHMDDHMVDVLYEFFFNWSKWYALIKFGFFKIMKPPPIISTQ